VYGRKIDAKEIARGGVPVPQGAQPLVDLLNQRSPRNQSNRPQ
jgi:lipid-binding SYLF domain-containing protein